MLPSAVGECASESIRRVRTRETRKCTNDDECNWVGLLAPAGTSGDIVRRWNLEVSKIMQGADIQQRLLVEGARYSPNTPEQFGAFIRSEIAKWAPVVKASGARVD